MQMFQTRTEHVCWCGRHCVLLLTRAAEGWQADQVGGCVLLCHDDVGDLYWNSPLPRPQQLSGKPSLAAKFPAPVQGQNATDICG